MQKEYKYKAFISYSHQNEKFGKWLHKSLEKYKIPKELRKEYADLPDKLYPIFRDREELPTSSDLSRNITEALKNSKYLIVICSVASAKSFWVNQEIIDFKSMHSDGEDRILAIILDGEPHAKDSDRFDDALECFPEALKYRVVDRKLSDQPTEPIAGDVREGKDGKEFGKLKLIAGLLGVGFEEIYRREEKRAKQRRAFLVGALGGVSALAGVSVWKWREASEKSIALEKQKIILQEEVERAKHNVGLVFVSKSIKAKDEKFFLLAHFYAYYALINLSYFLDTQNNISEMKQIVSQNSYIHNVGIFSRHSSPVYAIDISSDNKLLISASKNHIIKLWDIQRQKEVFSFSGHNKNILSIKFSPNNELIASASLDGTVKLWSVKEHKEIISFYKDENVLWDIQFSPNGKLLASSKNNIIKVWDIKNKKELFSLNGHKDIIRNISFSSDGNYLASASFDKTMKLWDLKAQKELFTFTGHKDSVFDVEFSPNGKYIASSSGDRTIKLWDIKTKKEIFTFRGHKKGVRALAFSPDGKFLASCSWDNSVKVWDTKRKKELLTLIDKSDYLITVKKWMNRYGEVVDKVTDNMVLNLSYTADGKTLITSFLDGSISAWDMSNLNKQERFPLTNQFLISSLIDNLRFIGSEDIVRLSNDTNISSFSLFAQKTKMKREIKLQDTKLFDFLLKLMVKNTNLIYAISENEEKIIYIDVDNRIKIWDKKTDKVSILSQNKIRDNIRTIRLSNNNIVAFLLKNNDVKIWDINKNKEILSIEKFFNIDDIVISFNGKFLSIISKYKNFIKFWNIKEKREIAFFNNLKDFNTYTFSKNLFYILHSDNIKFDLEKLSNLSNHEYCKKQIIILEQQLQAKLDSIKLVPTKIPYTKPLWSKYHPNHWLEDAENGDARAMYELGVIYDRDNENQTALKWYKKSDKAGYKEAKERVEFLEKWMNENV